jgi:hypothetical protein
MLNETSWKSRLLLSFQRLGCTLKDRNRTDFRLTRRGSVFAVLAACSACFLLTVWFTLPPNQPVFTEAQCDTIAQGMTEGEVESLLGAPAGDYRGRRLTPLPEKPFDTEYAKEWIGRRGSICVLFHRATDRVAFVYYTPEPPPNWIERVRDWLWR